MPLSPPTFTWHTEVPGPGDMSPGQAPAQVLGQCRPVSAPSGVNSWFRQVGPQPPPSTSEIQTLPVYPTPQPSASGFVVHDRSTLPGAVGAKPAGVPPTYRPSVVRAFGFAAGSFCSPAAVLALAAPPPASRSSNVMLMPPVLRSVSVFIRVWFGGTMNCSDVGLTSPRGVLSAKSCVFVWSSTIVTFADFVS